MCGHTSMLHSAIKTVVVSLEKPNGEWHIVRNNGKKIQTVPFGPLFWGIRKLWRRDPTIICGESDVSLNCDKKKKKERKKAVLAEGQKTGGECFLYNLIFI